MFLTFCGVSQRPPGNFRATISSETLKQSQAKKYTKGKDCEYIGLILVLASKQRERKKKQKKKGKKENAKPSHLLYKVCSDQSTQQLIE